jgi:hypothetical protein
MQNNIARFLNIIISFILKYALICIMQNKKFQAKLLYDSLYNICSNILTSSTSVCYLQHRITKYFARLGKDW